MRAIEIKRTLDSDRWKEVLKQTQGIQTGYMGLVNDWVEIVDRINPKCYKIYQLIQFKFSLYIQ